MTSDPKELARWLRETADKIELRKFFDEPSDAVMLRDCALAIASASPAGTPEPLLAKDDECERCGNEGCRGWKLKSVVLCEDCRAAPSVPAREPATNPTPTSSSLVVGEPERPSEAAIKALKVAWHEGIVAGLPASDIYGPALAAAYAVDRPLSVRPTDEERERRIADFRERVEYIYAGVCTSWERDAEALISEYAAAVRAVGGGTA